MRTHVWRKSFTRLSQRNLPLPVQRRHFHPTARQLAANPPPHPSTPSGRDGAEKEGAGLEREGSRKVIEEHGEDRASKRVSPRRSRLYSKPPRELPSFSIPQWFLKHNVRLQQSTAPSHSDSLADARCLNLVDRDTGHILLTLPFIDHHPTHSDHVTRSHKSRDQHKLDNFFSPAVSLPRDTQSSDKANLDQPSEKALGHQPSEEATVDQPSKGPTNGQLAESVTTEQPSDKASEPKSDKDAKRAAEKLSSTPTNNNSEPRLLMLLQLQLLLNASFAIAGPNAPKLTKPNIDLHTPDSFAHDDLDRFVESLAHLVNADLIRLDANDIAELAAGYLESGDYDAASTIASLPYDVYKGAGAVNKAIDIDLGDHFAQDDAQDAEDVDPDSINDPMASASSFPNFDVAQLGKFFQQNAERLSKALGDGRRGPIAIDLSRLKDMQGNTSSSESSSKSSSFTISQWDELKLQNLLDTLLDSTATKPDQIAATVPTTFTRSSFCSSNQKDKVSKFAVEQPQKAHLATLLKDYLVKRVGGTKKEHTIEAMISDAIPSEEQPSSEDSPNKTIVHIRDLEAIRDTPQGEAIIRLFQKVLQRRRKDGQQIVMVGTTAGYNRGAMDDLEAEEEEDSTFRSVQYAVTSSTTPALATIASTMAPFQRLDRSLAKPGYQRLVEINLRNIETMVRRLGLEASDLLFDPITRSHMNLPGTWKLGDYALTQDEVQQIVLYAESLRTTYTHSPRLETFHIAFAAALKQSIENTLAPLTGLQVEPIIPPARPRGSSKGSADRRSSQKVNIEQLKKSCDKHEKKLLGGVVDPSNLKTTFADVHAAADTKEALKTLTSLSLLRPEAFQYGVLANDRLPGLLLYGPPGTGKTMLAKAVAKDSHATVLEVSGAQVYEKYVGEGEKMVKAVFSLAKKLSPCIVFIDEADALFGSRGGANNRTTHREIINQFLREWDGMDDHSVFMMVATNRPFDLDDAVLRRLPRRLLVDLPVAKDRESILGIHLKGETLEESVSLQKLAEQTALYSGSDLKNVCVAAALTAVREENDLLMKNQEDKDFKLFKLPERRTLTDKHFDKALAEISASISEDMSTLSSIRKFDEQYGDRRAKRKKTTYGFGGITAPDENAARVRQDDPKP